MTAERASALLDPERLRRARSYRAFRLRLSLLSQATSVAVLLALHVAGAGIALRDALAASVTQVAPSPRSFIGDLLVISVVIVIGWAASLPFAYVGHQRGRREGIVVQGLESAFADQVKGLLLSVAFFGAPLALWYQALPRPDWWLLTIVGGTLVAAIATASGPLIASLFYRFTPLDDAALRGRIEALAQRSGVRLAGVYRWGLSAKTTAANAAVIGLGPTKRVVIGDTLLARYPADEVEAVVAHELAHQTHGDAARVFVLVGAGTATFLLLLRVLVDALTSGTSVRGAADVASYPLLAALLGVTIFVARPAAVSYWRSRELAADAFGARHTSARAMAMALVRLADQNLADPQPPKWEETLFMSHPAIASRVSALGQPWPPRGSASPA